jgi:HD-like signal output (HDOD) protein
MSYVALATQRLLRTAIEFAMFSECRLASMPPFEAKSATAGGSQHALGRITILSLFSQHLFPSLIPIAVREHVRDACADRTGCGVARARGSSQRHK